MTCRVLGCTRAVYTRGRCYEHHMEAFAAGAVITPRDPARRLERSDLVTDDEYAELLERQGGVCAICRQPESVPGRSLAVDHDHATGAVRGLLCGRCNRALGYFRDDPALLAAAITYLAAVTA